MTDINNDFYDELKDKWYEANDDPIAILRAEQKTKNPWVKKHILKKFKLEDVCLLDVGCGAGFLANEFGGTAKKVVGIDQSKESLKIAKKHDPSSKVDYIYGDAYELPMEDNSFHVVCAMDFLEHVENPKKVIMEIERVLKPGGLFFYHTFNRNFLSWLVIIKFMEWFVPNYPKNMHLYKYFIKPEELLGVCDKLGIESLEQAGISPKFLSKSFFKSLFTRKLCSNFSFKITDNLNLGYMGVAVKNGGV
jgi:2-polyprenyl-6-hydroxyphenyl methylase / 3-demethylubiquinone-9 3-methyltransferase